MNEPSIVDAETGHGYDKTRESNMLPMFLIQTRI